MGRVSKEQAEKNRQGVVEAASRLLREKGVVGVGVRELMASARLTPGAFYGQFTSKEALVAEACSLAFERAEQAFVTFLRDRTSEGKKRLVDHYLEPKEYARECPMATLCSDVARSPADSPLRTVFAQGTERLAHLIVADSCSQERLVLLAAMVGASMLGKAMEGTELADQLRTAVSTFSETVG